MNGRMPRMSTRSGDHRGWGEMERETRFELATLCLGSRCRPWRRVAVGAKSLVFVGDPPLTRHGRPPLTTPDNAVWAGLGRDQESDGVARPCPIGGPTR